MATQFCMGCGKSLPADAKFCQACGRATGVGASPPDASAPMAPAPPPAAPAPPAAAPDVAPPAPQAAPPPPPPPPAAAPAPPPPPMAAPPPPAQAALPPLGALLGLGGFQRFLVQHERGSWGRAYTVMTHEKRPLFTLRENAGQELWASVGQNAMQAPSSSRLFGLMGRPAKSSIWSIEDVQRGVRGALEVQDHGSATVSTLVDSAGAQILAVHVQRGGLGELTAIATFPDGQPMYGTKGNLMRHSFTVHAPNGAEVAKIHEAFASVHDSYNLDLVAPVDPLSPLVLAILIDREKEIR